MLKERAVALEQGTQMRRPVAHTPRPHYHVMRAAHRVDAIDLDKT